MKAKDTNQALDTPGPSLERLQLLHATRERLESSRAGSGVQRRLLEIISSAVGTYEPDPISGRKVVCFERVKELGPNEVLLFSAISFSAAALSLCGVSWRAWLLDSSGIFWMNTGRVVENWFGEGAEEGGRRRSRRRRRPAKFGVSVFRSE